MRVRHGGGAEAKANGRRGGDRRRDERVGRRRVRTLLRAAGGASRCDLERGDERQSLGGSRREYAAHEMGVNRETLSRMWRGR